MKTLLPRGIVLLALTAAPAVAADMPFKAPVVKAPPIIDLWTGGYVGINVGSSWGRADSSSLAALFPTATGFTTTANSNLNGSLFGAQAGFNVRFDPNWVAGIEIDYQTTRERNRSDGFFIVPLDPNAILFFQTSQATINEWRFPSFATFRGRLGVLAAPSTLLYATGGLALGRFEFLTQTTTTVQEFHFGFPFSGVIPTVGPTRSESSTRSGLAVGGGIEHKFIRGWSGKLEYLYLDFGSRTFLAGTGSDTTIRFRDHILRVGVNFSPYIP